ncbi:hypothetical protein [Mariniblastus fucicola]|uniref:Uncharacterized protein n=1 Tax=Mariniblastus fucicola TaxID=980251 RepID=A0A5B9PCE5_9BACT|nr:hypothetical protein [Mariniblastus fucicola]QEG22196.1 hypothetical protein MFFC18_20570 [Mariniblastus fucicola]
MSDLQEKPGGLKNAVTIGSLIATLVGLAVFNIVSASQLGAAKQREAQLKKQVEGLDQELSELQRFDEELKKLDSEYRLLNAGLGNLYSDCVSLDEFLPLFTDQTMVHTPESQNRLEAFIHVPKAGKHRIRVEAVMTSFANAIAHTQSRNRQPILIHLVELQPDSKTQVSLEAINEGNDFRLTVNNQIEKELESPIGRVTEIARRSICHERAFLSPNQFPDCERTGTKKLFLTDMIFSSKLKPESRSDRVFAPKVINARFYLESDGPTTSSPDDPYALHVMRRRLDAGHGDSWRFNQQGWYEFAY